MSWAVATAAVIGRRHPSRRQPAAKANIESLAKILNKYPDTNILIEGDTDNEGTEEYNKALSERRAQSVADYQKGQGVAGSRISTVGLGELNPVASNETATGRQQNRRVEVAIFANEKLNVKQGLVSPFLMPNVALIDPALIDRLPASHGKMSLDLKMRRFVAHARRDPVSAHASWRVIFADEMKAALYGARVAPVRDSLDPLREAHAAYPGPDALNRFLVLDARVSLVDDMLTKVDRTSMAHGLEVRVPLLDHLLVEWMTRVPGRFKVRRLELKHLLKVVARDLFRAETLDGALAMLRGAAGLEGAVLDARLAGPLPCCRIRSLRHTLAPSIQGGADVEPDCM
mgnify:CR=1 FL=1